MMKKRIILASKSPRRRDLLTSLGLEFEVIVSDCDESVPLGTSPEDTVMMLAKRKAEAVYKTESDAVVIGADTVVYLPEEDLILGKPKGREDAERILRMLSGRRHFVYTGVAVVSSERTDVECAVSGVDFKKLSDEEINDYISTDEPYDKAGAYGIQDLGGIFVTGIVGEYFNVTGMPKNLTAELLSGHGVDVLKYNIKQK